MGPAKGAVPTEAPLIIPLPGSGLGGISVIGMTL